jgi:hypothetical protein
MELSTIKILRDDVKIWLVYAGYKRRFFEDFAQSNRVFLNLPGFDAAAGVFQSDELMRRHLAMSDAVSAYVRGAIPAVPSRLPTSYNPYPHIPGTAEARSFSAELGNITRLFVDAQVGDLVMSPPTGHFDPFLIGEIATAWSKNDDLEVPKLLGEIVPTRRIKWSNVVLNRQDFPTRTSKRLQNRHAITLLDDEYYSDIFDLVYPTYSWQDRSKLDLFGDEYLGKDPMQPYQSALLLKYILSSVFAFEKDAMNDFQSLSINAAIEKYYDESLVEDIYQNFNSPGKFSVIAKSTMLAALATAGILMATADPNGSFNQQRVQTAEQIQGAASGPNQQAMNAVVDNYLNSLDGPAWKPVQKDLGVPAKDSLGLSLDNAVEVATHRAEINAN